MIVSWKMYDSFDSKGAFWTDSNALGMVKRQRDQKDYEEAKNVKDSQIASNYYPVDSAIAMRDANGKNIQVTIMNDRAQGGSADLSKKGSIELMQQRLTTEDDNKGVDEPLNETDSQGHGNKVTAIYNMQIFDYTTGRSKQRHQ